MIVVAQQLGRHLGHAVHRARALHRVLRRVDAWGLRPERADGARGEDGASLLAGDIEYVEEAVDLYVPGEPGLLLGDCGEQGREVIDGIYPIFVNCRCERGGVEHVGFGAGAALQKFALGLRTPYITCNDIALRIQASQLHREFGTDLAGRADHKNIFHRLVL